MKYEISVRPVTRYIVAEYHESEDDRLAGSEGYGEFANSEMAERVARMLHQKRIAEGADAIRSVYADEAPETDTTRQISAQVGFDEP